MRRLRRRDEGGVTLLEMILVNAFRRRRRRALLPAPCFPAPIS
jgi:hypothetical protein